MKLTIETEKERDGRWIGQVMELPGCLVYGKTERDAMRLVQALALRVIGDCLKHGEDPYTGKPVRPGRGRREGAVLAPIEFGSV